MATQDDGEEPVMEADADKLSRCCGEIGDGSSLATECAQVQPDGESSQPSVSNGGDSETEKELVEFKIIWNKNKYDVKLPLDSTGASLKQKIHSLTGLPPAMQKVMYKGLVSEEKTLRELKVTNGAKVMVVGSTINDVLAVNTPKETIQEEVKAEESKKEPVCRQKQHRKVLDKGKPDDVMPAIKGAPERLPTVPLSGMYNKSGGKVRLTFKLEQDQLWIGTKVESAHLVLQPPLTQWAPPRPNVCHLLNCPDQDAVYWPQGGKIYRDEIQLYFLPDFIQEVQKNSQRFQVVKRAFCGNVSLGFAKLGATFTHPFKTEERTEKIPMGSIKNVITEVIEGHEDYYMMAFQLGPTEASYYWVYWVPTQYVDAIKDTVLGKWQYF